jgi:hypothetical protein
MSVFIVMTYVVKPEKQEEFMSLAQGFLKYKKENPELFKNVKSWKLFAQMFGGFSGGHIEVWEFDNLTDVEKHRTRILKDERAREEIKKIHQEFTRLIEPATLSTNVWNPVM